MTANRGALPADIREHIVASIIDAVPTEEIYLFGSRARGDHRPDSDVDLYVITADDGKRPLEHMSKVGYALFWLNPPAFFASDVLCNTKAEFDRLTALPTIERTVATEGVRIYAANH